MKKLKIYEYEKCQTCRNALKWLDRNKIPYQRVPIVERPPSKAELKTMLGRLDGEFKRLFNTSGLMYRELKIGDKLKKGMTAAQAVDLLAKHGKLVKRPFVLTEKAGLVGFKEPDWTKALL